MPNYFCDGKKLGLLDKVQAARVALRCSGDAMTANARKHRDAGVNPFGFLSGPFAFGAIKN